MSPFVHIKSLIHFHNPVTFWYKWIVLVNQFVRRISFFLCSLKTFYSNEVKRLPQRLNMWSENVLPVCSRSAIWPSVPATWTSLRSFHRTWRFCCFSTLRMGNFNCVLCCFFTITVLLPLWKFCPFFFLQMFHHT